MEDDRRDRRWVPRWPTERASHPVGMMGAGALGCRSRGCWPRTASRSSLWSRTAKYVDGVRGFGGPAQFDAFLAATRILVCLLPLTAETENIVEPRHARQV